MSLQGNNGKGKTRNKEQTRATNRFNAGRYKKDVVGYSVMVHLPKVYRGRVGFSIVNAVVRDINDAGLYKIGTNNAGLKVY